jgi:CIC family chloride channel protein
MGAVFAGVIRAPMTSVLIIFEMTGGYSLILPLMIANTTSYAIARRFRPLPIYDALLAQDGIRLPHGGAASALAELTVRSAMTPLEKLVLLEADLTVADALERVRTTDFSTYPVVEGTPARFVGLVNESRLRRSAAEGNALVAVRDVLSPRVGVTVDEPLVRAMVRMNQLGTRQLPVLDREEPTKLVGLITMSDVVLAQGRAAELSDAGRPSSVPPSEPLTVR